ncbi:MAG: hypothetical protein IPJ69_11190 [Deltaproteobacteria bacterium]|nr:MAG: hypothetical protein IPJ69_11190 [Deltaproteobacteria bacterium]
MINTNTRLALAFTGASAMSGCYTGPSPESLNVLPAQDAGVFDARTPEERASVCLGSGDPSRTSLNRDVRLRFNVTQARGTESGCVNFDLVRDRFTIVPAEVSDGGSSRQIQWTGILRPAFVQAGTGPGVPLDGGTIGGAVVQLLNLQNRYTFPVSGLLTYTGGNCSWTMTVSLPTTGLPVVVGSDNCTATSTAQIVSIPSPSTVSFLHNPPQGNASVSSHADVCSPSSASTCQGNAERTITATLTMAPINSDSGVGGDASTDVPTSG